jgi:hypothetical protein
MVIATLQIGEPIQSNYQVLKFENEKQCQNFLYLNKIRLAHELTHALENLQNDSLLSLEFSCVIDKGQKV